MLSSCGGGASSDNNSSFSSTALYGFSSTGQAYVAQVDTAARTYSYQSINLNSGEVSGVNSAVLTADPSLAGAFSIYGHGSHRLALDADQSSILASVLPSFGSSPQPAIFGTRSLQTMSEIAGSYYLGNPYWFRLDIAANGTISLVCESFEIVEVIIDGITDTYDRCREVTVGSAKIERTAAPFFRITFSVTFKDLQPTDTLTSSYNVVFSQSASGKVAYAQLASSTQALIDDDINKRVTLWKEKSSFDLQNTWSGQWLFNRDFMGDSGSISLYSQQTGTTSLGYFVGPRYGTGGRNPFFLDLQGSTNPSDVYNANPVAVMNLSSYSRHFAVDKIDYKDSAVFRSNIPYTVGSHGWLGLGTSGPYEFPSMLKQNIFDGLLSLQIELTSLMNPNATPRMIALYSYDYSFDPVAGSIVLRAPLPSFDADGNVVRLKATFKLKPSELASSPVGWGIRLR
jgi:hypothetical protein